MSDNKEADVQAVNTIRGLCIDMIEQANSGHPGMALGAADIVYILFTKFLRFDPSNSLWRGRDRFVLSPGHGSALLYSMLHLCGFLPLAELKKFRQWESLTPGHPEYGLTPGVEATTGLLGQGFANGVGLALAAKLLSARLASEIFDPFDHKVYVLTSDGEMMEGIVSEASSLAGHLGLDNLIVLYDDNQVSIEGPTDITFSEVVGARYESYGWYVQDVDGHNHYELEYAIKSTQNNAQGRPSFIRCRTRIGYGSPNQEGLADCHGSPLGAEEARRTKKSLDLPLDKVFHVPEKVQQLFAGVLEGRQASRANWKDNYLIWQKHNPEKCELMQRMLDPDMGHEELQAEFMKVVANEELDKKPAATRAASGILLQRAVELYPGLFGGSADLGPSNKTTVKNSASVTRRDFRGRNIHYGIREHAMGAIMNGMALAGLRPFGGTFLVFSDYMKPAIRMAALMGLPVVYIFTHDSYAVGEDGPTHQPVEHIGTLRHLHNCEVFRPADIVEMTAAWAYALQRTSGPTAFCLSRQKLAPIERRANFDPSEVLCGGYVVYEGRDPDHVVISTGSELPATLAAARELGIRVVSMPCRELFFKQSMRYQDKVIPPYARVAAVEASSDSGWYRAAGRGGLVINIQHYGASAPADVLAKQFGFTEDALYAKLRAWLKI